jgi:alpha-D-xyloside xylohydrolase
LASHTRFHGVGPREPWEYGSEIETIIRSWLNFRYRLIPYLEECAQEAHTTGMPIMRAMPLAFPNDRAAWAFDTQYMLGPALLVAPLLKPGGKAAIYLPHGVWYDLWTGEELEGGGVIERNYPLNRFPLFGRKGASLILGPEAQHTDEFEERIFVMAITFGKNIFPIPIFGG